MVNLSNVGIGSIILNMIEDVPLTISGATLWNMVDNERYFSEQFTGDNIGTSIAEKYQPAIISLTASTVLKMMELQGADVSSIKLGDLNVSKGANSSTMAASAGMKADGIQKLQALGQGMDYYRTY